MKKLRVMPIFGTRPEAIKMAPIIKILQENEDVETITVVTAQHREMLDQVLGLFDITPLYDLNIMKACQSLTEITSRIIEGIDEILHTEKPDIVLVHGDTSTTFASALAAFYKKIPVGHVEAGLRTRNKYLPFPEEMNRRLTACIADLHFAPTLSAKKNLLSEGIKEENIFITGNTVIDALLQVVEDKYEFRDEKLREIDFENKKVILVTSHRRENIGIPMINAFTAIKTVAEMNEDVEVVFPVHKNPKVREIANKILGDVKRIHLIEPLDYKPFVNLINKSYLILTDSGGIQEEAPSLGKPVLVLRDTTERPEAVKAGTVRLVGTDKVRIIKEVNKLLNNNFEYKKMANAVNPYGDGKAADRIVKVILNRFGILSETVEEFAM